MPALLCAPIMHSGLPVAGFIVTVFGMEFDLLTYGLIASSFLLAGFVKGIVGLGLPTISLALLTALLDLPTAMAVLGHDDLHTRSYVDTIIA